MFKNYRIIGLLVAMVLGMIPGLAFAEEAIEETTEAMAASAEPVAEAPKIWSLGIELGAVVTTGNTEQENIKFVVEAIRDGERTINTGHIDGLRSAENNVITAQKYYAFYQLDYKLEDHHSLFARAAYEQDDFSGYEFQTDVTVGYSRELLARDSLTWRGDLGIGMRDSKVEGGAEDSEFITRIATDLTWQISKTSRFRQMLSAEIGEHSTITRSETSIQANIAGNLAMKAAITIKNQSVVPIGRKKRDTESSITLVYTL